MSRNDIRLRRQRMTATGANRFRNYSDVLERHERDKKIRKIVRVFVMFVLVLILIGLIFFFSRIEQGEIPFDGKPVPKSASIIRT
jgi:hypothetical protein